MSVSPDVKMRTRFLQDYRTFIAATLLNSADIGAINLTALVTTPSKTGFHRTIKQSPRQIQIQLKKFSTTLLDLKQNIARIAKVSRSLSDCQSLTLNVMIQVSQFSRNSQLCHEVTNSLVIVVIVVIVGSEWVQTRFRLGSD